MQSLATAAVMGTTRAKRQGVTAKEVLDRQFLTILVTEPRVASRQVGSSASPNCCLFTALPFK